MDVKNKTFLSLMIKISKKCSYKVWSFYAYFVFDVYEIILQTRVNCQNRGARSPANALYLLPIL